MTRVGHSLRDAPSALIGYAANCAPVASAEPSPITTFAGEYRWLSNFWPVPGGVKGVECGIVYPTVEHAYQAHKTADRVLREIIALQPTPGAAKRFGRRISPDALRHNWEWIKLTVMFHHLRRKFWPTSDLGNRLLATHPAELIEGNTWGDTYWGVCNGKGHNHLGQLLTMVRAELREQLLLSPGIDPAEDKP